MLQTILLVEPLANMVCLSSTPSSAAQWQHELLVQYCSDHALLIDAVAAQRSCCISPNCIDSMSYLLTDAHLPFILCCLHSFLFFQVRASVDLRLSEAGACDAELGLAGEM